MAGDPGPPHGNVPVEGSTRGGALRAFRSHHARLALSQWVTDGVNVVPTQLDGLHAKVLAWDENALLVSSLNWLGPSDGVSRGARNWRLDRGPRCLIHSDCRL